VVQPFLSDHVRVSSGEIILHVENDPDDVFLLKRAFTKAGISKEIRTAENGKNAIEYLEGSAAFSNRDQFPLPTVILLDWNMPLMSGGQFLQWLRAEPKWKRLPVIVLTSSAAERDMVEAYDLGANGFLSKPSNNERYMAMVRALVDYWLDWNRTEFRRASPA
jgi:CheY-like chemotaxis protein